MFNIDFRQIVYNLTPFFLRSEKNLAYIYALVKPLKDLNVIFNSYRTNTLYNLQFTSQTIYLEHFLNDQFDPIGRGIYIETLDELDFIFIFNLVESKPAYYLYNKAEAEPPIYFKNNTELINEINFTIFVPVGVSFNSDVLSGKVDFYNQAGKNYTIQTY